MTFLKYMTKKIIIHPPKNSNRRAFKLSEIVLPIGEYLKRNCNTVDECNILITTPKENEEILRLGT